jgi:hypothetical protein
LGAHFGSFIGLGTTLAIILIAFAGLIRKSITGRYKITFLPDKEPGNGHSCEYSNTHFKRKTAFNSKHISHVGGRGLLLYKGKKKHLKNLVHGLVNHL